MIGMNLDLLNKILLPRIKQLAIDIKKYQQEQQKCLREQQYIQRRIIREIELYKQRIKEKENA